MTETRADTAVLGLGRMGSPMAARLASAGRLAARWSRSARGEGVASSPAEAVAGCRFVVLSLADGPAVEAVLTGPDGVLRAAAAGTVVIDTSTTGPAAARRAAGLCRERGVLFLDAPVSGSVGAATAGQLLFMVGGDPGAYAQATPLFEALGRGHRRLGDAGAGAGMKLAVNLALAVLNQGVAEALALAEAGGVPHASAYDVLQDSVVGAPYLDYKRDAFLDADGTPPAFTADLMRKDVRLALDDAAAAGLACDAAAAAERVLAALGAAGRGGRDLTDVLAVARGEILVQ